MTSQVKSPKRHLNIGTGDFDKSVEAAGSLQTTDGSTRKQYALQPGEHVKAEVTESADVEAVVVEEMLQARRGLKGFNMDTYRAWD